ncbi:membrane bound O-acyl transferase family-domain-containing protein [Phanerochaete sordida]|uniref:Membrane bound O-acyl transferase family-domain-containing protein n=1 Tax=Phanerochaete sordida TaxID=48140 RepID=A0A9P3LFY4_9APHY|nr:membrane bound O-acyl transferase family-domain-containing protein [Phanerochaete sordida]
MEHVEPTAPRPPLPLAYNIVPQLALAYIIAVLPHFLWRLLAWAVLTVALLDALRYDVGTKSLNYLTGGAFCATSFHALVLLFLSDPAAEWQHETQSNVVAEMTLLPRVYNSACILVSLRGIGWNQEIHHVPPRPTHTRLGFVVCRALRTLWHVLLADIAQTYIDLNPIFSLPEHSFVSLRSQGTIWTMLSVVAYMTRAYCMLNIPYNFLAVVAVVLRVSEPKYWPVPFGRWKDAYTVRRFWGRVWHQQLRRVSSGIGRYVARALGCVPGTWLSSHVQLFVGFTVSGLSHVPGDTMVDPKWTGSSFLFFPLQAMAITAEDFVIALGKRLGIRDTLWVRLAGYTWTLAWFTCSVPIFIDWAVQAGLARDRLTELSVVRPAVSSLISRYIERTEMM